MNIVALCKTFKGDEFIEPMIRSIHDYVDKIVFINSEISWVNNMRGNTCKKEIKRVKEDMNSEKIVSIDYNTTNQKEQCMYGFNYIKNNFKNCDFVMLIDTDEVWDKYNLEQAINFLDKRSDHDKVYRSRLYTYIKMVNYRVEPMEAMRPCVFLSSKRLDMGESYRGCHLPSLNMENENKEPVAFHHFVYVRNNYNTVLQKVITSNFAEGNKICDMSRWKSDVWNKLPNRLDGEWSSGFHPAVHFKKHWVGIKKIQRRELPEAVVNNESLMEKFYDNKSIS